MASRSVPALPSGSQAGISLVEVIIAMFILALMSVAVLPLMIGGVQASATNRDLVAANSLASAQLADLQAAFPNSAVNSCAAVEAKAASGTPDPAASGATASISVGTCPSSYPGTVTVSVKAFRAGYTRAVVTLDSAILVTDP
jgi:type II secretory pathway pseudopilin PulG